MKFSYPKPESMSAGLFDKNAASRSTRLAFFSKQSPEAQLRYFRNRNQIHYFTLKSGKPKHVSSAERILRNEFDLNNELHTLAADFDWLVNPSRDPEWQILLHKFYYSRDLALAYDYTCDERYAAKWVDLVDSWIRKVPDGFVNSQVTGRRLQQWLLAYHYFIPNRLCLAISADFLQSLLRSMQSQAIFLSKHLTPEGNHRTIELSAIFAFAVLFPELPDSARLMAFATHELLENLSTDFLADGVQKELSTDYHHTVLKNFLRVRELADLNNVPLGHQFDQLISKALDFSIYAHKPDGFLPAINDGDINSYLSLLHQAHRYYPDPALLYVSSYGKTGKQPEQRSKLFADSGYCVLRSAWTEQSYQDGRYLLFDCGNLGFGSHGHYDLLNFEAAAFGRSLVVDPGRYTYHDEHGDLPNWRHTFKGTAAHNTVMVDGKDQIAYHCQRPIGPEPVAKVLNFVSTPGFDFVHGRALSPQYPVEHQRSIFFAEQEYWIISDVLTGEDQHRYEQFFHLASDALNHTYRLEQTQGQGIDSPNLLLVQPANTDIEMSIEQGWLSPEYGIKHPAPVIRFSQQRQGLACFQTVLYPYRNLAPNLCVTSLPVTSQNRDLNAGEAMALSIKIKLGDIVYNDCLFVSHQARKLEFRFADICCRAQLLFIRRNANNAVLSIRGNFIEMLQIGSRTLLDCIGDSDTMNYVNNQLYTDPTEPPDNSADKLSGGKIANGPAGSPS